MLDCLNDDELHTLYGYLQRIIDASSDSERYLSSTPSAGT